MWGLSTQKPIHEAELSKKEETEVCGHQRLWLPMSQTKLLSSPAPLSLSWVPHLSAQPPSFLPSIQRGLPARSKASGTRFPGFKSQL